MLVMASGGRGRARGRGVILGSLVGKGGIGRGGRRRREIRVICGGKGRERERGGGGEGGEGGVS